MRSVRSRPRRAAAVLAVVASILLTCQAADAQSAPYEAVDLGTLGGRESQAVAISNMGQVVGWSATVSGRQHAFSWTATGGLTDLGTLGGLDSQAVAVNDAGQVVGWSTIADGSQHAFSWTSSGGMVDLGTLGGAFSSAADVNAGGQVVGAAATSEGLSHAFSWTASGGMVDLGTLGGAASSARAINATGQIVGTASPPVGFAHAFSWTPAGGMVDLGALGGTFSFAVDVNDSGQVVGSTDTRAFSWTQTGGTVDLGTLPGDAASQAAAINAGGQVVGYSGVAGFPPWHAFVWTQAEGMVDLGTLGGTFSQAAAVNDGGQVVGFADSSPFGPTHAFSWTSAGGMVDLGTLGGTFSRARAINASGQIVGNSTTADGSQHAVLWNPAETDTTPPELDVPDAIAVDATSPSGAAVEFTVSATDDLDPAPSVSCEPASGATFPIGDTTVACSATDQAGNTATAGFVVHVRGAAEQLTALRQLVASLGLRTAVSRTLDAPLQASRAALDAGRPMLARVFLDVFVVEVRALSPRFVSAEDAAKLVADAARIRAVIGA